MFVGGCGFGSIYLALKIVKEREQIMPENVDIPVRGPMSRVVFFDCLQVLDWNGAEFPVGCDFLGIPRRCLLPVENAGDALRLLCGWDVG